MIEIGTFTGELSDEKYVGVKLLHGEEIFACPVFAFPLIAVVTQEWLDGVSDKYMAVVGYQDDLREKPLLIGLKPLKNSNFPSEGYEHNYYLYSKYFRIRLDDQNKKCIVDCLDNNAMIMLGDQNVTEPGVLGDKNAEALKTLAKAILDFIQNVANAVPTPQDGGASLKAQILSASAPIITTLNLFKTATTGDADKTKAKNVKLK